MFTIKKVKEPVTYINGQGVVCEYDDLESFVRVSFRYVYDYTWQNKVLKNLNDFYCEGIIKSKIKYYGPGKDDYYVEYNQQYQIVKPDGTVIPKSRIMQVASDVLHRSYYDAYPSQGYRGSKFGRRSYYFGRFHNHKLGSLKAATHIFKDEGEPDIRGKRKTWNIPSWYDESSHGKRQDRNWKEYRKTQWK